MGDISAYYALPHPPIVIPEVGRGREAAIQKTIEAFQQVSKEIEGLKPDTIILVTPHGPVFQDAVALMGDKDIQGSLADFRAPRVLFRTKIDMDLVDQILHLAEGLDIQAVKITKSSAKSYGAAYMLDHGAMVPMYFINQKFTDYKLVHITYGLLSKTQLYQFGMCIKKAVEQSEKKAVFIASGDLSHRLTRDGPYEYSPYGEMFDQEVRKLLETGDVPGVFGMDSKMVREAGECALRSYYILLGALDGCEFKGQTLSYQGNFGVGYLIMVLDVKSKKDSGQDNLDQQAASTLDKIVQQEEKQFQDKRVSQNPYVRLAGDSLLYYLINGDFMEVPSYVTQEMMDQKKGVFVTLKKNGDLRGCIGTIRPVTSSLAQEIIRNAVEAGIFDPRFSPVTREEWGELEFSVDVLDRPEPVQIHQLDPEKYGVIVRSGMRSGLLLPNLEGVDTVEKQLNIALQKAGITPDSPYMIERFQVSRHKDEKA
jgi:AmmeMemoRadiSam system protein A/AmmeMemoRadiSam system protein B